MSAARPVAEVAPTSGWRFGRRQAKRTATLVAEPAITIKSMDDMTLPIATFGNVTTADARGVAKALIEAAREWPQPSLYFSGANVVDAPQDRTVWVRLMGDVAALTSIARGVPQSVERLGFFVDRRRFHQFVPVVTAASDATDEELAPIVAALEALRGKTWKMDAITLFTTVFIGSHSEPRVLERIPIGSD